jgi:diacylglycerol kinase
VYVVLGEVTGECKVCGAGAVVCTLCVWCVVWGVCEMWCCMRCVCYVCGTHGV